MKKADDVVNVIWFAEVIIAPDGILTTLYPPSVIDDGVPLVNEKSLAEPDLSFHTLKLLPELNVIEDVDVSAASSHKAHPPIDVGLKYGVLVIGIYFVGDYDLESR